ncbi:MAG: hypothetical protein DRP90_06625 [Planctomycetota bacterium]|nr:MAG: hypothetical protein DRP90_06625 [Planctomycetota bacterium]
MGHGSSGRDFSGLEGGRKGEAAEGAAEAVGLKAAILLGFRRMEIVTCFDIRSYESDLSEWARGQTGGFQYRALRLFCRYENML